MRSHSAFYSVLIASLFIPLLLGSGVEADETGTDVVNIETYIQFMIEFDKGDTLHLSAEIEATPHPITVLLIKGQESFDDWVQSETVDVEAIKNGTSSVNRTDTFEVIENFSEQNVRSFKESIDIGDHDTYYLVIALHRDDGMDVNDVLERASYVQYHLDWDVESRELDHPLLIVALVFFILGLVFMVLFFISWSRSSKQTPPVEEEDTPSRDRRPVRPPVKGRRSPPLR